MKQNTSKCKLTTRFKEIWKNHNFFGNPVSLCGELPIPGMWSPLPGGP